MCHIYEEFLNFLSILWFIECEKKQTVEQNFEFEAIVKGVIINVRSNCFA